MNRDQASVERETECNIKVANEGSEKWLQITAARPKKKPAQPTSERSNESYGQPAGREQNYVKFFFTGFANRCKLLLGTPTSLKKVTIFRDLLPCQLICRLNHLLEYLRSKSLEAAFEASKHNKHKEKYQMITKCFKDAVEILCKSLKVMRQQYGERFFLTSLEIKKLHHNQAKINFQTSLMEETACQENKDLAIATSWNENDNLLTLFEIPPDENATRERESEDESDFTQTQASPSILEEANSGSDDRAQNHPYLSVEGQPSSREPSLLLLSQNDDVPSESTLQHNAECDEIEETEVSEQSGNCQAQRSEPSNGFPYIQYSQSGSVRSLQLDSDLQANQEYHPTLMMQISIFGNQQQLSCPALPLLYRGNNNTPRTEAGYYQIGYTGETLSANNSNYFIPQRERIEEEKENFSEYHQNEYLIDVGCLGKFQYEEIFPNEDIIPYEMMEEEDRDEFIPLPRKQIKM